MYQYYNSFIKTSPTLIIFIIFHESDIIFNDKLSYSASAQFFDRKKSIGAHVKLTV